ncbi:hypothetical protein [Leptospira adleri]|uniref:hypothetical protein n=1 Tax=Leptospira adleri TaxID=2023186 RepID=UPI0010825A2B|nr:hypothetical protein [Leptospira adleri]TGM53346.1 hypothetical protein EHQ97_15805 [Leptospira adleri]
MGRYGWKPDGLAYEFTYSDGNSTNLIVNPIGASYNCSSYANGSGGYGYYGLRATTTSVSSYYFSCASPARLICVRK